MGTRITQTIAKTVTRLFGSWKRNLACSDAIDTPALISHAFVRARAHRPYRPNAVDP
jgi:hypothetical protein